MEKVLQKLEKKNIFQDVENRKVIVRHEIILEDQKVNLKHHDFSNIVIVRRGILEDIEIGEELVEVFQEIYIKVEDIVIFEDEVPVVKEIKQNVFFDIVVYFKV